MTQLTTQQRLDAAVAAEDHCYKSCSDYSCVRNGGCTGHAAHEVRNINEQLSREHKQARLSALDGNT